MKYIVNGRLVLPEGVVEGQALAFDSRVAGIFESVPAGAEVIDAGGGWVTPGLIDVHCHGFQGMDASSGDGSQIAAMSERLVRHGVTAWLPTTMTLPWPRLEACFAAIRGAMGGRGARVLGCHTEGPFISPRRKGAQSEADIQRPDIEKLRPWADVVRLMTVAPEAAGAPDFIREARKLGVRLSMGHTDATAAAALAGFAAGIDHVTHTFNAMPPLHHRQPGALGAALSADGMYCELIADGLHVSPVLFPMLAKLKPEHLVLITDSIPVAGLPDGPHSQRGETVIVNGPRCTLPDGTLAGSALTLDAAVRSFARHGGVPLWKAVNMASLHPARSIGADDRLGALLPGKAADIVIADGNFNVLQTYVDGRRAW